MTPKFINTLLLVLFPLFFRRTTSSVTTAEEIQLRAAQCRNMSQAEHCQYMELVAFLNETRDLSLSRPAPYLLFRRQHRY
ncbi:hypothetical protein BO94DRAFT_532409 [Aspergillus sclerotioniger CBS 115572]|uniref:Uncharacterized protein n=1 Tax=Aspergillus sclerotioniger CBS 115572 TaxID=1450535 RepID=A0A317X4F2_9EURO|nr:hypothetical protein BO94DRAFT_532409 [Aspergillus sclerotioniger CBS 115572]PWY93479.1 hypothetical protein BO94DRAFT_532409 [Aspergillus sclerotioniger CBS 115572]